MSGYKEKTDFASLVRLVERLSTATSESEQEENDLLAELEARVPGADFLGLIFHPPVGLNLTPDEIVRAAMAQSADAVRYVAASGNQEREDSQSSEPTASGALRRKTLADQSE